MTSLKRYPESRNGARSDNFPNSQGHRQKNEASDLLDQIPVPFATIDIHGFVIKHNDLFSLLLGHADKGLMKNVLFADFVAISSQERIEKALKQTNDNSIEATTLGNCVELEPIWLKKVNGSVFPARVSIRSFLDQAGEIERAITVIDETSNYDLITKMEQESEDLKKKDKFKNEFVTIASHELRTPIQPILGFAFLATQGLMPQDKAWEGVLTEARRLQQLANDILDVSRIDSDQLKYEFKNIRMNEVLVNTIESLKTDMKKDISIVVSIQDGMEGLEIEADKSRMAQVVTNVVGNAIKFTDKGEVRIESRAFRDQNRFELRVSDTGRGIPVDILPKLFEKFMTKNHGDATTQGTGLGLYITKSIVNAHRGRITGSNNPSGGATFVIELPISRSAEITAWN
jgi:signal transduction histidine kinase